MTDILQLSALELAHRIKEKELTVADAVHAVYQRIEDQEIKLHCYITIRDLPELLAEADVIQHRIDNGELNSPLAGVPIAIKDNICTKDIRTTCGSRILDNFFPPYSATVIERIQAAGLIIIGKTNMDEFGMGSTTESSAFGITRNPHNTEHCPGGSSGGSCAAVASGEAFLALGSDTGGSIRQPAAHCGVYGLKPTYGAVSRYGLIAYASSLDQIGPIGKTAADCSALFDIICGSDPKDATSQQSVFSVKDTAFDKLNGLRIGIPLDSSERESVSVLDNPELSLQAPLQDDISISPVIRNVLSTTIRHLQKFGASITPFSFGLTDYLLPTYYIIACAEASSNLSRYDGVKYGYRTASDESLHTMYRKTRSEALGTEVQKRILLGTFTLSAGYYDDYYLKALKAKNRITARFDELFSQYDLLLLPTTTTTAPPLEAYTSDPIAMYQSDLFTVPANLAGLPAINLPAGADENGLPVGVQLIGKRGADHKLLHVASILQ